MLAASAWAQTWLAPAKLNLFLHVVGRRADGYHLLESVFTLIDWCDVLRFEARADGKIVRATDVPGIPAETDLIVRAAKLLQGQTGVSAGVSIHIHKRLPQGGGLGGGSSDAATTLLALNHLWQSGLTRTQLMALGLQLGADVPFFLFGHSAFARGVGEELTAVVLEPAWYVVAKPPVSVPTPTIFSDPHLKRDTKAVILSGFVGEARAFLQFPYTNDLEPVATRLFPAVGEALAWLGQFGVARMTGSGACVFAIFASEDAAKTVAQQVPAGVTAVAVRGLREHPHRGAVADQAVAN